MTIPKTLEQMAEEYQASMGHKCGQYHGDIASAYRAGAQAALRLPEVLKLRELASDYSAESCWPNCGECWTCDFEKALAAFDQLLSEGAK